MEGGGFRFILGKFVCWREKDDDDDDGRVVIFIGSF
jgi:hypothetical protein